MTHLHGACNLIYCHVVFLGEIKVCGVHCTVFAQAELYID
jgi:hypothetical protein